MNNKGFTFVEMLGVIVLLGILSTLAIGTVSRTVEKSRKSAYEDLVKSTFNATEDYVMDHMGEDTVTLNDLVSGGYLKNRKDPNGGGNCTGKVTISRTEANSTKIAEDKYVVYVCCKKYKYKYNFPGGTGKTAITNSDC